MKVCPACGAQGPGPTCAVDGATLIERTQPANLEGSVLKQTYRVERKIGEGGFGAVYEGTHLSLGRRVAIKTLLPGLERDSSLVTRFFREARLLSQLSHPNIVTVFDGGNTETGVFFLVMELLDGSPLNEWVGQGRGLPFATAIGIFKQICAGVEEAHRVGLVHRDLKPANVFLEKRPGRGLHVKVLDFGLARHVTMDTHITRDGFMLGTPGYAAPEQITASAEPDARSDVYGLGAILYFLLAGRNPFGGENPQSIMARQLSAGPEPLPETLTEVPPGVAAAIFRAMEADPAKRFAGVSAFWQDVALAAAGGGGGRTAALPVAAPRNAVPRTEVLPAGVAKGALPATAVLPVPPGPTREPPVRSGILQRGVEMPPSGAQPATMRQPHTRRNLLIGTSVAGLGAAGFVLGTKLSAGRKPLHLGMSAAFSGPSQLLGRGMHVGVQTRLLAAHAAGELPRAVDFLALDDGYEPLRARQNMVELLGNAKVLAVVGNVGTPTAVEALPLALTHKTPFIGAVSGAALLRRSPPDRYVFNYRAGYEQETAALVDHFVLTRRIRPEHIAVFAQQDSFGDAGMKGVSDQLRRLDFPEADRVLRVGYERNKLNVLDAVEAIDARGKDIEAVIMVATYRAAARFIEALRQKGQEKIYGSVSFVDSEALAEELRGMGTAPKELIVTQVVPHPRAQATGVIRYREALERFFPEEAPSFVSLEGYVVGSLVVEALKRCERFEREALVDALETIKDLDVGIGTPLSFGPSQHDASDRVWGTTMQPNFQYESLELVS